LVGRYGSFYIISVNPVTIVPSLDSTVILQLKNETRVFFYNSNLRVNRCSTENYECRVAKLVGRYGSFYIISVNPVTIVPSLDSTVILQLKNETRVFFYNSNLRVNRCPTRSKPNMLKMTLQSGI
jgi:hypothetical protein